MKLFGVIFTILYVVDRTVGPLPPSVPKCQRNHPNMSQCIVNVIEVLRPRLVSGNLGCDYNVKSIDPFYIQDLQYGDEAGLKVHLRDVYIYGGSKFKIEKFRTNLNELKFDVLLSIPTFDVYAKYWMKLNFLGIRYRSQGDYFARHVGVKIFLPFRGKRVIQNCKEIIKFDPLAVQYDRGNVTHLKISNLFGGNKNLEEVVHSLLRNNPDYIYKNLVPHLNAELSKIFTEIMNKIVEGQTFDELFPV